MCLWKNKTKSPFGFVLALCRRGLYRVVITIGTYIILDVNFSVATKLVKIILNCALAMKSKFSPVSLDCYNLLLRSDNKIFYFQYC